MTSLLVTSLQSYSLSFEEIFLNCLKEPAPGLAAACMVNTAFSKRVYFEANVEASRFDGSTLGGNPECSSVLYDNNHMYATRSDPSALACALMVCGQDDALNESFSDSNPACGWFKYIFHSERDRGEFRQTLQDLKNYLALLDIEKAKQKSKDFVFSFPDFNNTIFAGVKDNIYGQLILDKMGLYDTDYVNDIFFKRNSEIKTESYVKQRLDNFCSNIEDGRDIAGNSLDNGKLNQAQPKYHCASVGYSLPYDLLAGSLWRDDTIAGLPMQNAAQQFITHLVNPQPIPLLANKDIYLDPVKARLQGDADYILQEKGRKHLTVKFKEMMTTSTAYEIFRQMYQERMPIERDPEFAPPENVSREQAMVSVKESNSQEAYRRFHSPEWFQKLNLAGKTALLREIAQMMANDLAITSDIIKQLADMEMLLAMDIIQLYEAGDFATNPKSKELPIPSMNILEGKLN